MRRRAYAIGALTATAVVAVAVGVRARDDAADSPPASVAGETTPAPDPGSSAPPSATTSTVPATTAPTTSTTEPPATTTTTEATTTTSTIPDFIEERVIGTSVEDRPIIATRRGTPGGVVVLVVGVIHGNEDDGMAVTDRLRTADLPANVDLWLIERLNPDGQFHQTRTNANDVDLNRNFPYRWARVGERGTSEYSGPGPASEPETQAFIAFAEEIQPRLTVWYHQDLFRLQPSSGLTGRLVKRYAAITGLPILRITGGTYRGVAATWVRRTIPNAISFIVELGPTLTADEADLHTAAVLEIAALV